MFKNRFVEVFATLAIILSFTPAVASAAFGLVQVVPDSCRGEGGCQSVCDLAKLAQNVLTDAIYIAVFLSAVLFAWAGFKYLTAFGNSGKAGEAKAVFFNVAVGLVIILVSWLIVNVIITTLTNMANWNQIC